MLPGHPTLCGKTPLNPPRDICRCCHFFGSRYSSGAPPPPMLVFSQRENQRKLLLLHRRRSVPICCPGVSLPAAEI